MASIRRRGRRWYVRRYVGGRQIEEALGTTSARKAQEIQKKFEARKALGFDPPAKSKTPLAEFLQDFSRHLRLALRGVKSWKNDTNRLTCFFRQVTLDRLESLTPALIRHVLDLKRSRDGISPRTHNHYREILRRMFEYARSAWGFVSPDPRHPNPVDAVQKCPEPAPRITYLKLEEIDGLLLHLTPRIKMQAAAATLICTGLRRSEFLWLTVEDLDLQSRLVMVRGKTVDGETWEPKTRKNRAVPVSDSLLPYLERWVKVRPDSVWLFPALRGGRWDPDNFSAALREAQRGLGHRWSCLDFRHTFASHLAKKGVSIYKIAKLLGNSVAICERHYAHLCPADLVEEVEFRAYATRSPAAVQKSTSSARSSARRWA